MAHDHADDRLRRVLGVLSAHPLTDGNARRAQRAIAGHSVPLRPHEVAALTLPTGAGHWVVGVTNDHAAVTVRLEGNGSLVYAHPFHPPAVSGTTDFSYENLNRVRMSRLSDEFAAVFDDVFVSRTERVTTANASVRRGPNDHTLQDGEDAYVLSLETEQVREPVREGFLTDGDDGKRRDARVRSIDGSVNVVVRDSRPKDWDFIAKVGNRLVLTGAKNDATQTRVRTSVIVRIDEDVTVPYRNLLGNGMRVRDGALVACDTDVGPGFLWIRADEVDREYPLYGPLKNIKSTDEHALEGWHVEDDTLFLTRYSRD
ncbi:hypothetical protein EBS80_00345 [bacterium]|nr:hypothetical protein [bacterium]